MNGMKKKGSSRKKETAITPLSPKASPAKQAKSPLPPGRGSSDLQLAAIFSQVEVGLSELSLQGRFLRVNKRLCRMLGRTQKTMLGLSVADVTIAEDLPNSLKAIQQLLKTGKPVSIDKRYRRPDGTIVWANSSLSLIHVKGRDPLLLAVTVDLSERKRTELALQKSELKYRTLFNSIDEGFTIIELIRNKKGKIIDYLHLESNPAQQRMTGVADLTGKRMREIIAHAQPSFMELLDQVIQTGEPLRLEYKSCLGPWLDMYISSLGASDSETMVLVYKNITERKEAEETMRQEREQSFMDLEAKVRARTQELKESRDMLQTIFDASVNSITYHKAVRDGKGRIVDFEGLITNTTARSYSDGNNPVSRHYIQTFPGVRNAGIIDRYIRVVETGQKAEFELHYPQKEGDSWFHIVAVKLADGLVITTQDISATKKAAAELLELKLNQQKEILTAIVHAQEQERQRIGEALHNGVAQLLYGIQTRLQNLDPLQVPSPAQIKELNDITVQAIQDTRQVSFELVPAVLKDFGVEMALKTLFNRTATEHLLIRFEMKGLHKRLPENIEFTIYRITQELINNIIRHAHASEALIEMRGKGKTLSITVKDNGRGFSEKELDPMAVGIGLQSVRNRVKLMEGSMEIDSKPSGTSIQLKLPVMQM